MVKKPNGRGWRFCTDLRWLNELVEPDRYPLPKIQDTLELLKNNMYFSVMDASKGFWQIPIAEKDRCKTATITPWGLDEYNVMPFGFKNAPAVFQRFMDMVLSGLRWIACVVYVDDICVFGDSFELHKVRLGWVLDRMLEYGVQLSLEKSFFAYHWVGYLGYIISREGISADPRRSEAVLKMKSPTNRDEARSFLAMFVYFKWLIPNYHQASPIISNLLRSGVKWEWGDKEEKAANLLREGLAKMAKVYWPDMNRRFYLRPDACKWGVGGVLLQKAPTPTGEEKEYPVLFYSSTLTRTDRKWYTTEKEGKALLDGCEASRRFIEGVPFTIETDHDSLRWILKVRNPTGRLARWAAKLAQYVGFAQIDHIPGKDNVVADALSRHVKCPSDLDELDDGSYHIEDGDVRIGPDLVELINCNLPADHVLYVPFYIDGELGRSLERSGRRILQQPFFDLLREGCTPPHHLFDSILAVPALSQVIATVTALRKIRRPWMIVTRQGAINSWKGTNTVTGTGWVGHQEAPLVGWVNERMRRITTPVMPVGRAPYPPRGDRILRYWEGSANSEGPKLPFTDVFKRWVQKESVALSVVAWLLPSDGDAALSLGAPVPSRKFVNRTKASLEETMKQVRGAAWERLNHERPGKQGGKILQLFCDHLRFFGRGQDLAAVRRIATSNGQWKAAASVGNRQHTLCTWNVNSIRRRLKVNFKEMVSTVKAIRPDVLVLTEVRCQPADLQDNEHWVMFLRDTALRVVAQHSSANTRTLKGLHGVMTLSRRQPEEVMSGLEESRGDDDEEGRVTTTIFSWLMIVGWYVPCTPFAKKITFLNRVLKHCQKLQKRFADKRLVIIGDTNITADDRDVLKYRGGIDPRWPGCTKEERHKLYELLTKLGLTDAYRRLHRGRIRYTWASPRRWQGPDKLRVDHVFVPRAVWITRCWVHGHAMGSDHKPVVAVLTEPEREAAVVAPVLYRGHGREWDVSDLQEGTRWLIVTMDDQGREDLEPVQVLRYLRSTITYQYLLPTDRRDHYQLGWIDPRTNQVAWASQQSVEQAGPRDMRARYRPWTEKIADVEFLKIVDAELSLHGDADRVVRHQPSSASEDMQSVSAGSGSDRGADRPGPDPEGDAEAEARMLSIEDASPAGRGDDAEHEDAVWEIADRAEANAQGMSVLRRAQRAHEPWADLVAMHNGDEMAAQLPAGRKLAAEKLLPRTTLERGLLYYLDDRGKAKQIMVPPSRRVPLIWTYHHTSLGGHVSAKKLIALLKASYWWPGMATQIRTEVAACECRHSFGVRRRRVPLRPRTGVCPLQVVSMDLYGPLPVSWGGNVCVLSMQCVGSRWPEFVPLQRATSAEVAHAFVTGWICRHGVPKAVIMDQGPQFTSRFLRAVMENLQVEIHLVPVDRHISNPVERLHRTLGALLRLTVSKNQRDWDRQLPFIAFAVRAYDIGILGASPFQLLKGMSAPLPDDTWISTVKTYEDGDRWLAARSLEMRQIFLRFRERERREAEKSAAYYQRKVAPFPEGVIVPGADVALLRKRRSGHGRAAKLKPGPYVPGYRISQVFSRGLLELRKLGTNRTVLAYEDDVRPLVPVTDPDFHERQADRAVLPYEESESTEAEEREPRDDADVVNVASRGLRRGMLVIHRAGYRRDGWALGRIHTACAPDATAVEVQAYRTKGAQRLSDPYFPGWVIRVNGAQQVVQERENDLPAGGVSQPDTAMVPVEDILRSGFQLAQDLSLRSQEVRFLAELNQGGEGRDSEQSSEQ
jgi:exodeoxyribonuclease III